MANQHVVDLAEHFNITESEARKLLKDIQDHMDPLPPFRLITKTILDHKKISEPKGWAKYIVDTHKKYHLKGHRKKTRKKKNPKNPKYRKVKDLLYPDLSIREFNNINLDRLSDASVEGIAKFIASFYKKYILRSDIQLYKDTKDLFYPKLSTNHFIAVRQSNPNLNDPDKFIIKVIQSFDDYILKSDKSLFFEVKNKLKPDIPVHVFSKTVKQTSTRNTDKIALYIMKSNANYVLRSRIGKISKLVYPSPEIDDIVKMRQENANESNPDKLASMIIKNFPEYISIAEKPFYERIDRLFKLDLPVNIFSRIRKYYPDLLEDPKFADLIDRKYPGFELKLYKEAQNQIYPRPSTKTLRDFRVQREGLLTAFQLSREFVRDHLGYMFDAEKAHFDSVDKLLYPNISVHVYRETKEKYPEKNDPTDLARMISSTNRTYIQISELKYIRRQIFPSMDRRDILKVKKNATKILEADELANHIIQKNPSIISAEHRGIYHEVKKLIYPDLPTDLFSKVFSEANGVSSAVDIAKKITKTNRKYMLESRLEEVISYIFPDVEYDQIISVYRDLSTSLTNTEIAAEVAKKIPGCIHVDQKSEYEKYKKQFDNHLTIRDFSELRRIYADLKWEENEMFLNNLHSFCVKVRDLLQPEPSFKMIIHQMEKHSKIKSPKRLARITAREDSKYSLYEDVLKSKAWYDD